jgi:hypothetical protein
MDWVIACLVLSSGLNINHDWLTTAVDSTDSLKVMVLGTKSKAIVVERVFAPWNSTTRASDSHAISNNDLSVMQATIWWLEDVHAPKTSMRELVLPLKHDPSVARIHSAREMIFLVTIMRHNEWFIASLVIIKQGEKHEAIPDLLCCQSIAELPVIITVTKVVTSLGNCV